MINMLRRIVYQRTTSKNDNIVPHKCTIVASDS